MLSTRSIITLCRKMCLFRSLDDDVEPQASFPSRKKFHSLKKVADTVPIQCMHMRSMQRSRLSCEGECVTSGGLGNKSKDTVIMLVAREPHHLRFVVIFYRGMILDKPEKGSIGKNQFCDKDNRKRWEVDSV